MVFSDCLSESRANPIHVGGQCVGEGSLSAPWKS